MKGVLKRWECEACGEPEEPRRMCAAQDLQNPCRSFRERTYVATDVITAPENVDIFLELLDEALAHPEKFRGRAA